MALTLPKSYAQDVTQPIKMRNGGELVFTGNADVDTISVVLYNGGVEYEPGGTVTLNCIRADGVTMVVPGAVSGNVVSATLTQACCAVPGMMTVVMQLTNGGTGAIFAAVYNVLPSSTETVGDAGTIIEDVAALIANIDAAVASVPADYTELLATIAPTFSASTAYAAGQYVWYNGTLYRFTVDHAAGAWVGTDATAAVVGEDVSELKIALYGGEYAPTNWQDGMIYNASVSTNSTYQRTGTLALNKGEVISFTGGRGNTQLPVNALTRVVDGAYQSLKYYAGTSVETITYTATVDMIVIVSTLKTAYGNDLVIDKTGTLEKMQDDIDAQAQQYDDLPDYIKSNVEPSTFVLESSGSVQYAITKGETYIIKNNGTNTIAISTRVSQASVSVDLISVAAGAIKQFEATGNAAYLVCSTAASFEILSAKTLVPFIESTINKLGNYGTPLPLVRFDFNRDFGDYADDLSGVDFMANNGKWYSIMQTVYDKFDSLMSAYPNYVTRVDAAEDVSLSYPEYANLGGEASGNYSPTPTYKTYLYKLVDNNTYVYSSRNPKKKLFLLGATHGNETAGAFNLYLLAKNLCMATNSDYFKLREAYDVYIVPCLNGYGMCHYVRWNADGVDINRNYPISNWAESGEPYVIGYTGPSAASEFETQLVVALQNKYAFDVAIDHHNYGASTSQFYTEFWYERFNALANAALADCSSMFIEFLPTYFGANYRLFVDITNSTRPNVVLSDTMPCMAKWMWEQGLDFAATIEIGNQINYIGGQINTSTDIPKYTNDVFKVGEFTLRNQLLYYCGYVLGGMV